MKSKYVSIQSEGIDVRSVNMPKLKKGWARIQVQYAGLCGSDLQKIDAILGAGVQTPSPILGHEFVGQIVQVHQKNQTFQIGNYVVGNPLLSCDVCEYCQAGNSQLCQKGQAIGRTHAGAFSDYVDVPETNLFKLETDTYISSFVLVDVLAVCIHALSKYPSTVFEKKCLVIGDGAVGAMLAYLLKLKGAHVVMAGRAKNEEVMKHYVDVYIENTDTVVEHEKYDVVLETVGRKQDTTLNHAISSVKRNGTIIVLGVFPEKYSLPIEARTLFYKEVLLIGANSYNKMDFVEAVQLIKERRETFQSFITHSFHIKDFEQGYKALKLKKKNTIKVIFKNLGVNK
ncbi:zinc-dependent alcohol dehydrogenase [Bacillus cereus]|uniref:zinc-dependent alcohol dehydrogenase n=1 Tax=Bacillus cereus TaxID=1396 RepID=UPI000BEB92C9|nr:zinc-binding dehydrogenase [Bacillus cereus]PEF61168.1 hypothetical protein CON35_26780 [Bacillus cereus]